VDKTSGAGDMGYCGHSLALCSGTLFQAILVKKTEMCPRESYCSKCCISSS